jgi:tRNA pseudouridine55 synthase
MFAAINIHKPLGLTSHDVVARLRRIFNMKKIGHLGTLDPQAEGVLPICLGRATRLIEYFPSGKRYTAMITLGRTTTTLDREGEVVSETDCSGMEIRPESMEPVLARFTGTIQQQVPLYSAVHVGGKKLYEIARKQERAEKTSATVVVELPTREVTIEKLKLLNLNLEDPSHPVLTVDVSCSSGTYIRSLARDIGEALGCGAFLSGLIRTEHGHFRLMESVSLETLQTSDRPEAFLLNPLPYLDLPIVPLERADDARRLSQGQMISLPAVAANARLYMATFQEQPVGVVEAAGKLLKPVKIFGV